MALNINTPTPVKLLLSKSLFCLKCDFASHPIYFNSVRNLRDQPRCPKCDSFFVTPVDDLVKSSLLSAEDPITSGLYRDIITNIPTNHIERGIAQANLRELLDRIVSCSVINPNTRKLEYSIVISDIPKYTKKYKLLNPKPQREPSVMDNIANYFELTPECIELIRRIKFRKYLKTAWMYDFKKSVYLLDSPIKLPKEQWWVVPVVGTDFALLIEPFNINEPLTLDTEISRIYEIKYPTASRLSENTNNISNITVVHGEGFKDTCPATLLTYINNQSFLKRRYEDLITFIENEHACKADIGLFSEVVDSLKED